MPTEDGRVDGSYEKLSRDELLRIASKLNWMHSIDLGDGFVTTGQWPPPNAEQIGRAHV